MIRQGVAASVSSVAEGKAAGIAKNEAAAGIAGIAGSEAASAAAIVTAVTAGTPVVTAPAAAAVVTSVASAVATVTAAATTWINERGSALPIPPDEHGVVVARDEKTGRDKPPVRSSASRPQRPGRSLKGRALAFLSRREYSRTELFRKLGPFAADADALDALLDTLAREGWLSDERFAESLVHRRAAKVGSNRIVSELKQHAVNDDLIEAIDAQLCETELARAQAVWHKKYGQLPATPVERARQARFLAARGFSLSVIGKILKGLDEDWSSDQGVL